MLNRVRRGTYADSVVLMRISRAASSLPGVSAASLMIGTPSNKALLRAAKLLAGEGEQAQADDLVIAIGAASPSAARAALEVAGRLLDAQPGRASGSLLRPRDFSAALAASPHANLALISVPGAFAAAEARRAFDAGLHVMMFSDNVPVAEELALKRLAVKKGLLLMGPDCGSSIIGGVPLGFANAVPRGDIGIVASSGTGLQEVSCLLARAGCGVSQAIGAGGRDLSTAVGGLTSFAALDLLETDPATRHIVIISKPPAARVARALLRRVARSRKPFTLCLLGARGAKVPPNARLAATLHAAAEHAAGRQIGAKARVPLRRRQGWIRGLFCGGTLCAEAQLVLRDAGLEVRSNAPVPGAKAYLAGRSRHATGHVGGHLLLDLGADEYTQGRPHPMIDPEGRNALLEQALADPRVAVVLLDLVIGYGAHADPAGMLASVLGRAKGRRALVIASVTGTEGDPQGYGRQVSRLRRAGALVAESNAQAAALAAASLSSTSAKRNARRAAPRAPAATRRSASALRGRGGAARQGRR